MLNKKYNPNLRMIPESTNKNKGFTIIEVISAIFVLLIGILASYTVIQQIIGYTSIVSSRLVAAYLAQEGIEIVRNIRDTNWLQGEQTGYGLVKVGSGPDWEADYTTTTFIGTEKDLCGDTPYYNCHTYNLNNYLKILDNFYKYPLPGTPTKFQRRITVTSLNQNPDADEFRVSVVVFWKDKGKSYTITAQEYLYSWY